MNIVRVVAVFRDGGHSNKNYSLVLLCGINESHQIEDGEWMGYIKNDDVFYPFILRDGKSFFYGYEEHSFERTNIGQGSIEMGRFFTIWSQPGENEAEESTYEVVSCHVY